MTTPTETPASLIIPFDNAYARLPESCFAKLAPTPVQTPGLIRFNTELATELRISFDDATDSDIAAIFSGNRLPAQADPLAMAYCGHQFGQLNPQLGDGRAILLGDLVDVHGQRRDIQLKGSGRTPFSRGGDGRSPLGPALREYILCEAMHALGVPTTRALAVVSSGEPVLRERAEPGAVFTRVAASHIRVGTFQYFALRQDSEALQALADHVLERHYPTIDRTADDRYLQLFSAICQRQAQLIAQWLQLGFIHGVMNTDNMTVSGETIDYGPCAFMDAFSAGKVFSSIDQGGRYAYQNQSAIGQWNLARLAEAMLTLFPGDEDEAVAAATTVLKEFADVHGQAWQQAMGQKLGFGGVEAGDLQRISALLELLEQGGLDYTLFFRRLCKVTQPEQDRSDLLALLTLPDCRNSAAMERNLHEWLDEWQQQLRQREPDPTAVQSRMLAANPAIIPRNHRVAEAIAAAEAGDYAVFENLLAALAQPYAELPQFAAYQEPPQPAQRVHRTFCGT
ncbi:MAG: YdiU family protein [Pseudomonadota bacterium]|nr:YdiU family protein [Pseudomonadota bacterium]